MTLFDDDEPFDADAFRESAAQSAAAYPIRVLAEIMRDPKNAPPRNEDGTVHYSDLKRLSTSGLAYFDGYEHPWQATRAARIGTAVHRIALGGPPVKVYREGTRRGAAWDAFVEKSGVKPYDILNGAEAAAAEEIATALLCHPTTAKYLKGARHEVPLRWDLAGLPCSTRGIDILFPHRFGDLKVFGVEPDRLLRHAEKMLWHAQLGFYDMALDALGYPPRTEPPFLLVVQSARPYDVVVLELNEKRLEAGRQCCHAWLSQLRVCEATGVWPGYSTAPIEWGTEDSIELIGDDEDEEGEAA